jgi:hypothetical protein
LKSLDLECYEVNFTLHTVLIENLRYASPCASKVAESTFDIEKYDGPRIVVGAKPSYEKCTQYRNDNTLIIIVHPPW